MSVVEVKRAGELGIMVLNNGKLNQLSWEVFRELEEIFTELSLDDDVKVIILTANPGPVFCAGADVRIISEVAEKDDHQEIAELISDLHELTNRIADSPKRTIAAVNGLCFGGGLELALACNFIVAAPLATFSLPEVSLGIIPGLGGTQRLPRRIGSLYALRFILSGEIVSSARAANRGLVDRIIEGDFIAGVKAFNTDVSNGIVQPRPSEPAKDIPSDMLYRYGKGRSRHAATLAESAVQYGMQKPLHDALRLEIEYFVAAVTHSDARAGIDAFFSKKPPVFKEVIL